MATVSFKSLFCSFIVVLSWLGLKRARTRKRTEEPCVNALMCGSAQVYDGDNVHFPLVGTFCGTSIPSSFLSSGNLLTLRFVSDGSVQKAGFNATYRAMPRKTVNRLA